MDISLNRLIRFHFNNILNLRPVNYTHYAVLYPQNGDRIVTIDYVTSLHSMYSLYVAGVIWSNTRLPSLRLAPLPPAAVVRIVSVSMKGCASSAHRCADARALFTTERSIIARFIHSFHSRSWPFVRQLSLSPPVPRAPERAL